MPQELVCVCVTRQTLGGAGRPDLHPRTLSRTNIRARTNASQHKKRRGPEDDDAAGGGGTMV